MHNPNIHEIRFRTPAHGEGRNRSFQQSGLVSTFTNHAVRAFAVSGKGTLGACWLDIPVALWRPIWKAAAGLGKGERRAFRYAGKAEMQGKGRNGVAKIGGLDLMRDGDLIVVNAVRSKTGTLLHGHFTVPVENLHDLLEEEAA